MKLDETVPKDLLFYDLPDALDMSEMNIGRYLNNTKPSDNG